MVSPKDSIFTALEKIQCGGLGIALVVGPELHLRGIITDPDIRRIILRGIPLSEPVESVMNKNPIIARKKDNFNTILGIFTRSGLEQLPILDEQGRVVFVERLSRIIRNNPKENIVVVMAGGMGTRLRPLTEECPKPMLLLGDKPILEVILNRLIKNGFSRFYFAVNYKANMIERHFGDGKAFGVEISYLKEDKRLGTVGPLSLLPMRPDAPFFVVNGDVLTDIRYSHLLEFHESQNASAVMCVREYDHQIPYGVVRTEGDTIIDIIEKPVHSSLVNAGVYVLEPEVLDFIPDDTFFDMPSLFMDLIRKNHKCAVYPITDSWFDVGRKEDLDLANQKMEEGYRR